MSDSVADAIDEATAAVMQDVLPDVVEPEVPVEAPEDVKVEPPAEPEPAKAEPEPEAEPEPKEPELPEGYVAVPVVSDKLATDFVLRDANGEVEVPALMVEYKANGKVRQDRLDQVVKLAQFGVYNQEREAKVQQTEAEIQRVRSEQAQYAKLVEEREAQLERLLTDDEYLASVRQAYERENSPENRVMRAEAEAKQLREMSAVAPAVSASQTFFKKEVAPAIGLIAQSLPGVTTAELEERLEYVALALAKEAPNGLSYLPPDSFDKVRKFIVDDLAIWAQIQHQRRTDSQPAQAKAPVPTPNVDAQKAKRQVGIATKPVGRAAPVAPTKKTLAPTASVEDAMNSALSEIMESVR